MKRREFMQTATGSVVALATGAIGITGCARSGLSVSSGGDTAVPESMNDKVPDTLDLSMMATLGLNGILGLIDADHDCEMYAGVVFNTPRPWMGHVRFVNDCTGKLWESLPYFRLMTGSDIGQDLEAGYVRMMLGQRAPDGLFYYGLPHLTPWHELNPPSQTYHKYPVGNEPYASVLGNARNMLAMMACYQQGQDEAWLQRIQATADGLRSIAVVTNGHAYFPDGSIGTAFSHPLSGWRNTLEPGGEHFGGECSVLCYYGQVIRAMTRWFKQSGDRPALKLATDLVAFCQQPKMWAWEAPDTPPKDIQPAEQAAFLGHVHGHLAYLRGVLEYATATDNHRLQEFARSGYEYARKKGLARIGCFGEGCAVADMVALAIRLSDAGLGDYWDDASAYVRNQLFEMQFNDAEKMERIAASSEEKPDAWNLPVQGLRTRERVIERGVGQFSSGATPVNATPTAGICCIGNCSNAIYYAWESALRETGDAVQINMLFSRASSLMDVESWLPFQGLVVLRNKKARTATIRIPGWVRADEVRCSISGVDIVPSWAGRYLIFGQLNFRDEIRIRFPIVEDAITYRLDPSWWYRYYERYTPEPKDYHGLFRGDTCIAMNSSSADPKGYLIYQREAMRANVPPMKKNIRHTPEKSYQW